VQSTNRIKRRWFTGPALLEVAGYLVTGRDPGVICTEDLSEDLRRPIGLGGEYEDHNSRFVNRLYDCAPP
jgi:hypothetical protein